MGKLDWDDYFGEKKNVITLIVLLSILAIFVIRNSVSQIQAQWLDEKHSIIAENEIKIETDKNEILKYIPSISLEDKNFTVKNPQILSKTDVLVTEVKDYSLKNLYVYYVDFKDGQTTKNKLQELKVFVDKYKFIPSHDKIVGEIDGFYNNVSKYKSE